MKKRILSTFLALCLMISALAGLTACDLPFFSGTPTEPEPTEPEITLTEQTMNILENTETIFRTIGRTYERNKGLACDFACTGIEFAV